MNRDGTRNDNEDIADYMAALAVSLRRLDATLATAFHEGALEIRRLRAAFLELKKTPSTS